MGQTLRKQGGGCAKAGTNFPTAFFFCGCRLSAAAAESHPTADGKKSTADGKKSTADGKKSTSDGKKSTAGGKSTVAAGVRLFGQQQQLLMRTYLRQLQPFTQAPAPVPAQLAQMFHVEQRNRLLTI